MRQLIARVDDDLHARAKRRAAAAGLTLNQLVVRALEREFADAERPRGSTGYAVAERAATVYADTSAVVRDMRAAARAGRLADPEPLLTRWPPTCRPPARSSPSASPPRGVLQRARDLCDRHPVCALDALHLAVA